jgi:hypothetical protein
MYRRFYIEYFSNGVSHRQRIRRWANENRQVFPEYGFTNTTSDFPITHYIAYRLENQFGFVARQVGNEVTLRNLDRSFRGFNN